MRPSHTVRGSQIHSACSEEGQGGGGHKARSRPPECHLQLSIDVFRTHDVAFTGDGHHEYQEGSGDNAANDRREYDQLDRIYFQDAERHSAEGAERDGDRAREQQQMICDGATNYSNRLSG